MFQFERRVGRLIEMRVGEIKRHQDLTALLELLSQTVAGIPGKEPAVIAIDYRSLDVLLPEVAASLSQTVGQGRWSTLRTAILLAPGHTIARLQLGRLTTPASSPVLVTASPTEMETWLAEVLRPDEKARLHEFLNPVELARSA